MDYTKEELQEMLRKKEKEEIKLKKQKKIEFSKIILIGVTMAVTILTLFSFVMIYVTRDLSPLSYLIPAWFTEFSIATGFYYNKAKAENITKIEKYNYEEYKEG